MTSSRITCMLVAAVLLASAPIAASAAPKSPVVATDNGPVRGTTVGQMQAFRGIPYAAAPVGDLRWRAPQAHSGWHGVLDASALHGRKSAELPVEESSTLQLILNLRTARALGMAIPRSLLIRVGEVIQ